MAMAQWVNRLWNKIFVNPPPLPLLCEISGALHLVLRQAGRPSGWLAGRRNTGEFQNFQLVVSFNQGTASLQLYQWICG